MRTGILAGILLTVTVASGAVLPQLNQILTPAAPERVEVSDWKKAIDEEYYDDTSREYSLDELKDDATPGLRLAVKDQEKTEDKPAVEELFKKGLSEESCEESSEQAGSEEESEENSGENGQAECDCDNNYSDEISEEEINITQVALQDIWEQFNRDMEELISQIRRFVEKF